MFLVGRSRDEIDAIEATDASTSVQTSGQWSTAQTPYGSYPTASNASKNGVHGQLRILSRFPGNLLAPPPRHPLAFRNATQTKRVGARRNTGIVALQQDSISCSQITFRSARNFRRFSFSVEVCAMSRLLVHLNSAAILGLVACVVVGFLATTATLTSALSESGQLTRASDDFFEVTGGAGNYAWQCTSPGSGCSAANSCGIPNPVAGQLCNPQGNPSNPTVGQIYNYCGICTNQPSVYCVHIPGGSPSCIGDGSDPCPGQVYMCEFTGAAGYQTVLGSSLCLGGGSANTCTPLP